MKGYMSCTLKEKTYRMWKNSKPKLCKVIGGPKQRFTVKELYVGDASLQCYGPSKWVWLRLEIKQNHWSILKRSCISYQFTADVQTYGRQWCSRDWRVRSKMLGCCLMFAAASAIREVKYSAESTSYQNLWLLDWMGRAHGLASQVTGPNMNGLLPMGPH